MMKAAQFYGVKDVRINTVPTPSASAAEKKVLIDVEWCGICGSDLHEYLVGPMAIPTKERPHPITGASMPVTMGHEFCGRVAELYPGYEGPLKVGMGVMIDPRINCQNACTACGKGATNICDSFGFLGLSGGGGGLSEKVAVSADMCHALPDNVDMRLVALIEPLAVARRAVRRTKHDTFQDKTVLILGGGPIGLATVMDLKVQGVGKIIVSEPTDLRRRQIGQHVDIVLDSRSEDVPARCRELTNGQGVDIVFDCAGVGPAMNDGMAALKAQGTYMNVAGWETPFVIPFWAFMSRELDILCTLGYDEEDFATTVRNFTQEKYQGLENMVTSRIGLDDVKQGGFEELINNKDSHIKILVTPKAELLDEKS